MRTSMLLILTVFTLGASKPDIIPPEKWNSKPQPIPDDRKHTPKFITIHHAGVLWKSGDDPVKKIQALQLYGQREKKWPDLPYHFLIAPDGRIFAGRPVEYEPETNTEYKVAGHIGVELWGNFEKQRPTKEQLGSLVKLTAWLTEQHKIDLKDVGGHKDRAKTDCPGRDLHRYFEDGQLKKWIQAELDSKPADINPGEPLINGPTEPTPTK